SPALLLLHLFFLIIPHPPSSTLFPYTTLFRSAHRRSSTRREGERPRRVHDSCRTADAPLHSASHRARSVAAVRLRRSIQPIVLRSEEHTSELQSLTNLVCRLLLEKKQTNTSCT